MSTLPPQICLIDEKTLEALPPSQPVIVMTAVDGMRPDEYARRTGIPLGTVKKMLSDGRLPRIKKSSPHVKGKNSVVLVNVAKLVIDAMTASF